MIHHSYKLFFSIFDKQWLQTNPITNAKTDITTITHVTDISAALSIAVVVVAEGLGLHGYSCTLNLK